MYANLADNEIQWEPTLNLKRQLQWRFTENVARGVRYAQYSGSTAGHHSQGRPGGADGLIHEVHEQLLAESASINDRYDGSLIQVEQNVLILHLSQ